MGVIRNFPLIPCEAPLWARDRHSQTILGDILPSPMLGQTGQKWILDLPDHDRLVLRVYEQNSPWVVTLFHGLTGSADAKYVQRAAAEFLKLGHTVVLMNHRNCGEGKGLARKPYHSGKSDDLGFVINEVRKRFPSKKVLSIGYSMSANALLLLLSQVVPGAGIFDPAQFDARAEQLQLSLPDAAVTINAPINLEKSSRQLSSSLNKVYELSFMTSLHLLVKQLEKQGNLEPSKGLHPLMSVSRFDDRFTAPRSGFISGRHYYETCSARNHLTKIQTPTVCLMSSNDPFIDYTDYLEAPLSRSVRLHLEQQGGHMGYLHKEKTPLGSFRWLDYGVCEIGKSLTKDLF